MNLDAIRRAATQDEVFEAANALFNAAPMTEAEAAEVDAAVQARINELNSGAAQAAMPDPPTLTLAQRNHYVVISPPPFEGYRIEYEAKIGRSGWLSVTEYLSVMFGGVHDATLPVPTRFSSVYVRGRYEGGEWGAAARLKQQERPRRVSRSNPYWHYWNVNDREGFSLTARGCAPGVNEVDADGNTIGHIIAAQASDTETDEHGNMLDDRGYNRHAWLGSLLGDGRDMRGAGIDVTIKNKHGATIADIWASNGSDLGGDRDGYTELLESNLYAGSPWR